LGKKGGGVGRVRRYGESSKGCIFIKWGDELFQVKIILFKI
jgi:hypothetical protein